MAVAAPSPLASSVEKTNGAKLSRLLIDGGTTVLRNVFDGFHSPLNLTAGLNANYPTLNVLLKKKVLRKAQWDQLFPPGGLTPNSKTFDITLLFVLLTNICRLSPPVLGWHINPHPTDNSCEANLARIKFYRNELYGHVSTTGIDTPVFNTLWQKISSVLVALGLDQAEIDRLKAENCGEEDYVDVLLDWADSEEDIKSQLSEIRQYQATTQQKIDKVYQTLLDDHEKHEYSKSKLDEVCNTQKYLQETLQDNKSKVDELLHAQTHTQSKLEELHLTQKEVKQRVETTLQERGDTDRVEEQVLQNLAKSEFKGDIEYHVGRYQEGTREWVFNKVENWLDDRSSQNRVMVISANAGMGKSVISAVISKRMQEDGRLSGSHFCQHNNARYRNPQLMLQSLACHLSHALPEYKQALIKQLSRNLGKDLNSMGVKELFALLFKEPLSPVAEPGRNMLMVIDGLDECDFQERNELLDVVANHLSKLPYWIRFLCTTRPERNIAKALKHLKPFQLESNDDKNVEDVRCFIENRTQHLIKPEQKDAIVEKLVEKSEGLMLYAYFLVLFIQDNTRRSVLNQEDLDDSSLLGISSAYHSYFKRLENELKMELGVSEENFLNLLSAVFASREPMPIEFVSKLLVPSVSSPLARRKVLKAISSVSSLLPIHDGCLHVIHKSVKDWLISSSSYGEHDFTIDEKEGHRILASLCAEELDHLKQKGVFDVELSSTEKYALHHGARHMLQLDENMSSCKLEKCVQTYVIDLELLYAKLFLNNSIAAEDVLWLLRQENSKLLSENSKGILDTLLYLLRKHYSTLTCHPRVFFQTVMNEGGSGLSPMASNLLQNKYPEIPYMEFVHNQIQQEAVLARFQCSSYVACFDVSPRSDYLVCECENGMIQLWSLLTGKLVWERPVKIKKTFYFKAFRKVPSSPALSHYRSVVFHPTMDIVLPGILSSAYGMDGDLIPLFPESKCSFTVCSVSGDKTSILTDCPDDARCIILWSLRNGSEISRTTRCEDVVSFAWSQEGRLLAISHSTGLICLVDVQTGFRPLAEMTTSKVCGMIKFAPDHWLLFCKHTPRMRSGPQNHFLFRLNVNNENDHTFSLDVFYDKVSFVPWKFESHSEGGFLLGDPILCAFDGLNQKEEGIAFLLTEQSVLISYRNDRELIEMFNVNELTKRTKASCAPTSLANISSVNKVSFSLNGESIYIVSDAAVETVSVMDVSSGKLKAEKSSRRIIDLVPVREGVLVSTTNHTLELWNSQVSICVHRWSNLPRSMFVTSVSEHLVAYLDCTFFESSPGKQVTFLDTTDGEIVSTMHISHDEVFVACNKKCQVITLKSNHLLRLRANNVTLWYKDFPGYGSFSSNTVGLFSPGEQFLILFNHSFKGGYVLEAVSGRTMNSVCKNEFPYICKFLTDEVCAVCTEGSTRHHFIRLFNVKSGDQLTAVDIESRVRCLDLNPRKQLIAIGLEQSKYSFKFIQVKLPRSKESQRMADTPGLEDNSESERMTNAPDIPPRTGIKRMANTPGSEDNSESERMTNAPDIPPRTGIKRMADTPGSENNSESERMTNAPDIPSRTGIKRGTRIEERTEEKSSCQCLLV